MTRHSLIWRTKVFAKEHPYTLESMNNLAFLLKNEGKYEEAEPIYWRTLQLKERDLGKEFLERY